MTDKRFITSEEVARELDVSKSLAYKVVRQLNDELKSNGFMTIAGKVNRNFFEKKFYGTHKEGANAGI
mgnify:CR=1 FL=1